MVVETKGYRVVPQRLADGSRGFRHVHLKEHRGAFKATPSAKGEDERDRVIAKGKTLFVGNVDDQGGRLCRRTIEERLRRALSPCGEVVHVQASPPADPEISGNGGGGQKAGLGSALAVKKAAGGGGSSRYAHVCFSSSKGVQRALELQEVPSGVSETFTTRREETAAGDESDGEVDDGDPEDENRDENGDATCGYAALIQRHRRGFPPRKALQEEVDSTMSRFEKEEAAEAAERKALIANPEDDDGFMTVTYKRKRGRRTNNPSEGGGLGADQGTGATKKKKIGAGELTDFYRFQMREARREQLATLRSKFEQDKARVAKMKENRKFKPF